MKHPIDLKKELPVLILLLIPFITLPFLWSQLPETVPIHWDVNGEPDRIAGKTVGLLLLPCTGVAVYLLFWLIPAIDPKRKVTMQKKPLPALRFFVILVTTFLFFVTIGAMLEVEGIFGVSNMLPLGILLLFLGIGNYMPSVQPNYFIGIKTPWTLQDDDIWRRTHRLGGRIWVICSLLLLGVWAVLPQPIFSRVMVFTVIGAMVMVPIVYSYVLFALKKGRENEAVR